MKKQVFISGFLALCLLASAHAAHGKGTAPGTALTFRAEVTYTLPGSSDQQSRDATTTITVAERIEVAATWQDAAPGVYVSPGQTNRVTTFRVTNDGNGSERYTLAATGAGLTGDQFDPVVTSVYVDANANNVYDTGVDTLYSTGTSTLAADGYVTVFVLSAIPASNINDAATGNVRLTATSTTGAGTVGQVLSGKGDGGVDAVIGASQGAGSATGTYVARSITVSMVKTVTVDDHTGGTLAVPGATLRYAIAVTATGSGQTAGLVFTDPLPANTTFTPGTLKLNNSALTDIVDSDAGDAGGTAAGTVTVRLSDMTSASPAQTITFDVTID